jgi:membrane protease YdiL (CAAX protease family)
VFIVLGVVVLLGYRALAAGRMPRGAGVSFEDLLVLDFAAKGLAAGAFFLVHRIRRSPVRLVRPDPSPGRSAAGGFLAGLAFLPVLMATGFLQDLVYRRCGWRVEPQDLVVKAVRGSPGSFAMVAFFVVAGAPLFEEFAFRGLLHSGLRTRLGPRAATLLAAAVFAGYHLQVDALPVLFLFGIWLSLLRERTGGLTAPIAAHACYNAFQMVGVWMARPGG